MILLALIGAVSLLGQVVLLRELNVACFGSELIYLLGMSLWLFGAAGGALCRVSGRGERLAGLLLAGGVVLPLSLVFARGARRLVGGVPGAYLPFLTQLFVLAVTVLPFAFVCGLLFRWAALRVMDRGRTLAAAYAADCGGAVVGGVASTVLIGVGISNFAACLACGIAAIIGSWTTWRGLRLRATSAVFLLLLVAGFAASSQLDHALTAWNHSGLLTSRDTPYGRLTAAGQGEQVVLYVNDALAYESQGTAAEEFVHLASLQHEAPKRILVLGGGWEDLAGVAMGYRPEQLVHVEMNRALLEMRWKVLSEKTTVGTEISDPRHYLQSTDTFDLILVGMPEPQSGLDNRYYTREFFQDCGEALAPDGVLGFRLRGAENVWTPALARRNAGVFKALDSGFDHVAVLPGGTNIFLASNAPLPSGAEVADRLESLLGEDRFTTRLVSPAYVHYLYDNDRFGEVRDRMEVLTSPMNTDRRPTCYRHTLVLWASRFFPALGWVDSLVAVEHGGLWRHPWLWAGVAGWVLVVFIVRRHPVARKSLAMAGAATAAMVLEMVLILDYQVRIGALFKDIGLLMTLFMVGLTCGATGMAIMQKRGIGGRLLSATPWGGLFGIAAIVMLMADQETGAPSLAIGLLLITTGAAIAAIFSRLGQDNKATAQNLITPLYSADLLGGGLGSLAAALFLIPVWGLTGAAVSVGVIAVLSVLPQLIHVRN